MHSPAEAVALCALPAKLRVHVTTGCDGAGSSGPASRPAPLGTGHRYEVQGRYLCSERGKRQFFHTGFAFISMFNLLREPATARVAGGAVASSEHARTRMVRHSLLVSRTHPAVATCQTAGVPERRHRPAVDRTPGNAAGRRGKKAPTMALQQSLHSKHRRCGLKTQTRKK